MEPRIRYATTTDGVSIAFATIGEGPPLVVTPGWWSSLEMLPQDPRWQRILDRYGQFFAIVSYDKRGTGLSDRGLPDYSIESWLKDLEAVVELLDTPRVALYGVSEGGPIALAYAAKYPHRVGALVLLASFARGQRVDADKERQQTFDAVVNLVRAEWGLGSRTLSNIMLPNGTPKEVAWFVKLQEANATREDAAAMLETMGNVDVSGLLPRIRVPTLVVHSRGDLAIPFERGRELASAIPEARFLAVEGDRHPLEEREVPRVQDAIVEFLLEHHSEGDRRREQTSHTELAPGTAVILFLDIAGSTALTTKLGDGAYREKERALDTALRAAITDAGGTPVEGKVLGDGVMAVFTSAARAIDAAKACQVAGDDAGLPLHIGIHAGDVVREGNSIHGGAVQLASRVQAAAPPGEILVSQTVRDLARTSAGVAFEDRGEHELKGITEPQRLFAVSDAKS